jgi:hypothetical protein
VGRFELRVADSRKGAWRDCADAEGLSLAAWIGWLCDSEVERRYRLEHGSLVERESPVPSEHDARELVAAHLQRIAERPGFAPTDEQITALMEKQEREARKNIAPMRGLGSAIPKVVEEPDRDVRDVNHDVDDVPVRRGRKRPRALSLPAERSLLRSRSRKYREES